MHHLEGLDNSCLSVFKPNEDQQHQGELADTDCTWISHSVLQRRADGAATGLGQKANDSLDMLFDTTACGEYKSYSGQSQPCEEEDQEEEEPGIPSDMLKW